MASALQSARALSHGGTLRHFASQNPCLIRSHCRLVVICSSPSHSSLSGSRRPPPVGRRSAALAVLFLHCLSVSSKSAAAGSPFDKYVKRKKLEPLEAYVPAVLLTEEQFKDLEDSLDVEQPKYDISRSLLRSGPAASLRVNIRAVAQYADDDGKGKAASDAVDRCLSLLQTVPASVLDKGKAIADSYRVPYLPTEEKKSEELDPELKKLEAIL